MTTCYNISEIIINISNIINISIIKMAENAKSNYVSLMSHIKRGHELHCFIVL